MQVTIKPQRTVNINFKEIWDYKQLFYTFAWRDVKVRYKQTVLGAAWAVIQPLTAMIIFTLLFNKIAKISSGEVPYAIFSYTGLIFWNFFSNSMNSSSMSLLNNQSMITKIFFPRVILPISSAIVSLVDFIFAFALFFVLLAYFRFTPSLAGFLYLIPMMLMAVCASTGVGMFFAALNVKYRDVKHIMPFLTQILLYLTPIIYPIELVPKKFQWLLYLNPMTGVITTMRSGFLGQGEIEFGLLGISAGMSLLALVIGFIFFKTREREFADII